MDFHLPKPLHGWRAFAGEVDVVVLGVLLALGAQQLVEAVHQRDEARQATELLRDEISDHYFTASEAVISGPCVNEQLRVLKTRLSTSDARYQPAPFYSDAFGDFVLRVPNRVWSDDVWKSAVSAGVPSNLTDDLRLRLGEHYSQVAFRRDDTRAIDLAAWRLRTLAETIQPDVATRTRLIEEIEETRGRVAEMMLVGNEVLGLVEDMKFAPSKSFISEGLSESGTIKFCRDHDLPLGRVKPKHDS